MTTRKHILVVEDEEHLATGIKYNLDAEGYRVTTVGDGPSALRFIEENPEDVDLVILDLMLPGMSGYEVCESLRGDEKHMPILILSARTLSEDRARGFDVGADQYLMKPFDLDEFLSRVKNLLARHDPGVDAAHPAAESVGWTTTVPIWRAWRMREARAFNPSWSTFGSGRSRARAT